MRTAFGELESDAFFGAHSIQTFETTLDIECLTKTVGREPYWCRLNSQYHKALALLF